MNVVIIKYNAGNVFSVDCALRRIGVEAVVTDDFELISRADRVIFPGVGEASTAMAYLRERGLDVVIKGLKQPVLGICVGLQLMCRSSEEGGAVCLGIFDTDVKRFDNSGIAGSLKIPHMGWNNIRAVKGGNGLLDNADGEYVYFVHSYYAPVCADTIAVTDYITEFSAAMQKDNFYATQFHPEKSGSVGESVLKRFIEL